MLLNIFPNPSYLAEVRDDPENNGLHPSREIRAEITNAHPLQHRLENWNETQKTLKREMKMNIFGRASAVDQIERDIVDSVSYLAII